jgi:propionyl-CoA synthetase
MSNPYESAYERSLEDPDGFWAEAAEDCYWYRKWDKVLDDGNKPFYRWFTGGITNTCYNALDLHVARGRGDKIALIYDSPVTDTITRLHHHSFRGQAGGDARCGGVLAGDQ